MNTCLALNLEFSTKNDGDFVKFRCLPGSLQPDGLIMRATLTASVAELTLPTNSSMTLDGWPCASMRAGALMIFGINKRALS